MLMDVLDRITFLKPLGMDQISYGYFGQNSNVLQGEEQKVSMS